VQYAKTAVLLVNGLAIFARALDGDSTEGATRFVEKIGGLALTMICQRFVNVRHSLIQPERLRHVGV
jgi:hypothetical protein